MKHCEKQTYVMPDIYNISGIIINITINNTFNLWEKNCIKDNM